MTSANPPLDNQLLGQIWNRLQEYDKYLPALREVGFDTWSDEQRRALKAMVIEYMFLKQNEEVIKEQSKKNDRRIATLVALAAIFISAVEVILRVILHG